jgi:hypothetical protein
MEGAERRTGEATSVVLAPRGGSISVTTRPPGASHITSGPFSPLKPRGTTSY